MTSKTKVDSDRSLSWENLETRAVWETWSNDPSSYRRWCEEAKEIRRIRRRKGADRRPVVVLLAERMRSHVLDLLEIRGDVYSGMPEVLLALLRQVVNRVDWTDLGQEILNREGE